MLPLNICMDVLITHVFHRCRIYLLLLMSSRAENMVLSHRYHTAGIKPRPVSIFCLGFQQLEGKASASAPISSEAHGIVFKFTGNGHESAPDGGRAESLSSSLSGSFYNSYCVSWRLAGKHLLLFEILLCHPFQESLS